MTPTNSKKIVATYEYTDADGTLLYESIRFEPKDFKQRQPDGKADGGWIWNLQGVQRVLYHLPQLVEAVSQGEQVFICEGEKDVHSLEALGYPATTSGSTSTWKLEFAQYLKGACVILVPDNDEPGKEFMGKIANDLFDVVANLSVLQLPALLPKEDVTDYLESDWPGSSPKEEFEALLSSNALVEIRCEDDIRTYITRNVTAKPELEERKSKLADIDNVVSIRPDSIGSRLVYKWASDVTPEKTKWLWRGWLVQGALHILAGQQSAGKTTWVAYVAAQLMRGKLGNCNGIKVGYISLEESGDRLSGRLRVAGADPTKIAIYETIRDFDKAGNAFERPWRLPQDTAMLSSWIEELGLSLVIVDGLGYAVAGAQDYATIGSALSALAKVAETTDCAILGLTHVKKGGTADAVTAAIGSTAWTAVPRIVWVLGLDPEDETDRRRLVAVSKTNYKEPDSGFSFIIANDEESEIGYVTNVNISSVSAHAIVAPRENREERSERSEARNLVKEILSDGWVDTPTLLNQTQKAGLSDRTVARARQELGVVSRQRRNPDTRKLEGWELSLPTPNGKKVGSVGSVGTLLATCTYTSENHPKSTLPSTLPLDFLSPENHSDAKPSNGDKPTCKVCGNPLLLASTEASRICSVRDPEHDKARSDNSDGGWEEADF